MPSLRFKTMFGNFAHLLWHARVGCLCENVLFFAHLVIVAQHRAQNPLAERFQGGSLPDQARRRQFVSPHGSSSSEVGIIYVLIDSGAIGGRAFGGKKRVERGPEELAHRIPLHEDFVMGVRQCEALAGL